MHSSHQKTYPHWQCFAVMLLLVGLIGYIPAVPTAAQEKAVVTWEKPILLSDPNVDAWPSSITTDQAGNVHIIWSQTMDPNTVSYEGDTIFYTRFDGHRWTIPTDVLVSPIDSTQWPDVAVTPNGMLHVIWGTGGEDSRVMYANAPACCAEDISQWSKPKLLYMPILESPVIVSDKAGHLHIAYASQETGKIHYQRSDDDGVTWSMSVALPSGTRQSDEEPIWPRLSVDDRGRVHLVWSIIPWPGRSVMYARSDDGGDTWNDPITMDNMSNPNYESDYGPILITLNTFGNDEIHMIWDGAPTVERNHTWSSDGGLTWKSSEIIIPEVSFAGRSGYSPMVKDSNNILYAASLVSNDPARYATWDGVNWTNSAEVPTISPVEHVKLVITRGNTLHLLWTNKVVRPYANWYIRGHINSPELPVQPLPTLAVPTPILPSITAAPTSAANAIPVLPIEKAEQIKSPPNPAKGIIIGIIPATFLVGVVLWFHFQRKIKQL